MEKMLQDPDSAMLLKESLSDCKTVKFFGPPTLGEFVEDLKTEVEHLKEKLSKAKEKEYLFRFGLERFSSSPEDINFYTGFPDYKTLVAFWQYIEPNAANLTYYSSAARDVSGFVSNVFFFSKLIVYRILKIIAKLTNLCPEKKIGGHHKCNKNNKSSQK